MIRGLRHGYDTMLGKWFDEGEELSVGEWQKVALARAFVRDAQILVFDEPTSALDPETEWRVFQHIKELARGRAVVLISHRFSTVRTADRIHILDGGRIVESGAHDELMALGGRYAQHVRGAGARVPHERGVGVSGTRQPAVASADNGRLSDPSRLTGAGSTSRPANDCSRWSPRPTPPSPRWTR